MARRRLRPAPNPDGRDVREVILGATRMLLDTRQFDELSVADILGEAGVARGSFYSYFESKYDVLAELVRRAVAKTQPMAEPWLDSGGSDDPVPGIRASHLAGAEFWAREAPLLRAIVENWRADPQLEALWRELMGGFAERTQAQIVANQHRQVMPPDVDPHALAATLTWLGERLYYLAAVEVEPFADQAAVVDMLTYVWTAALHPDRLEVQAALKPVNATPRRRPGERERGTQSARFS